MNLKMRKSDERLLPSTSVVVPAFGSEKTIGQTIESLVSVDYPRCMHEIDEKVEKNAVPRHQAQSLNLSSN